MKRPSWEEVRRFWEDDGALVDAFNDDLAKDDWQRLLDSLHASSWPLAWDASESPPVPRTSGDLFRLLEEDVDRLVVSPGEGIRVHCYFRGTLGADVPYPTSIECDFAKSQIRGQGHFDLFCTFVRTLGRAIEKPVLIADEGSHHEAWMRYDPATDEFVRVHHKYENDDRLEVGELVFWIAVLLVIAGFALALYAILS